MDINLISEIVLGIVIVILLYYITFILPKRRKMEKINFLREFSAKVNMELIFLKPTFAFAKRITNNMMFVLYIEKRKHGFYKNDFYIINIFLKHKYDSCAISDMASSPLFYLFKGKEKREKKLLLYEINENYENGLLKTMADIIPFKIFTGQTIEESVLPLFLKQKLDGAIYDYNTFIQFEISKDLNSIAQIVKFINDWELSKTKSEGD
ncbi:hypothetical protein J7L48_10325 [bacterium]|nr:hypothetical protein [bacterium]